MKKYDQTYIDAVVEAAKDASARASKSADSARRMARGIPAFQNGTDWPTTLAVGNAERCIRLVALMETLARGAEERARASASMATTALAIGEPMDQYITPLESDLARAQRYAHAASVMLNTVHYAVSACCVLGDVSLPSLGGGD